MFHFQNFFLTSFNNFSIFSGGINISSVGFIFTILLSYKLVTAQQFPKNSSVVGTTYLETVFKESSSLSNNCFLYLFDKFIANDKNA